MTAGKVEPASTDTDTRGGNTNTHSGGTANVTGDKKGGGDKRNGTLEEETSGRNDDRHDDKMMQILSNRVVNGDEWFVVAPHTGHVEHLLQWSSGTTETQPSPRSQTETADKSKDSVKSNKKPKLTCGKKINKTDYDNLRGVIERHLHSNIPEPDVAMVFKNKLKSSEVDMSELEVKLRKAKRDVEKSGSSQTPQAAQVYNLIGNFWRIKGNTQRAIECFRKALGVLPHDPDILLNLARVLFNLQYLDDAIFLARRSLHLQSPGDNSWLQHYTLGEILKSLDQQAEAAMHFKQALELNPGFQPAKSHLREMDSTPPPSVTHLTFFIIVFLVVGVLFGVVTSIEGGLQERGGEDGSKTQQRHFNRAMAMRSIKLGINPRLCRLRRAANS